MGFQLYTWIVFKVFFIITRHRFRPVYGTLESSLLCFFICCLDSFLSNMSLCGCAFFNSLSIQFLSWIRWEHLYYFKCTKLYWTHPSIDASKIFLIWYEHVIVCVQSLGLPLHFTYLGEKICWISHSMWTKFIFKVVTFFICTIK